MVSRFTFNDELLRTYKERVRQAASNSLERYDDRTAKTDVVGYALQAISRGDTELLLYHLAQRDIERMSLNPSDELLAALLEACMQVENLRCAQLVMLRWRVTNPLEGRRSLHSYMFTTRVFSDALLRFLKDGLEATGAELIDELIQEESSDITGHGVRRVLQIYPEESEYAGLKRLQETATRNGNDNVAETIGYILPEISPEAPRPPWMRLPTGFRSLPTEDEVDLLLPEESEIPKPELDYENVKSLARTLTEGEYGYLKPNNPEVTERLERELTVLSLQQRKELAADKVVELSRILLQQDAEIFRILGPVHPMVGTTLNENHRCAIWGGCRMFDCVCYARLDDETENLDPLDSADWFIGYCQVCKRPLESRYHAVRLPLEHGSWEGCYCYEHWGDDVLAGINKEEVCEQAFPSDTTQEQVLSESRSREEAWGCPCETEATVQVESALQFTYLRLILIFRGLLVQHGVYDRIDAEGGVSTPAR